MPTPCLGAIPRDIACVTDYEPYARHSLDDNAWAYVTSAAADELTYRRNRAAFDDIRLNPRILADVRGGHTRLDLFGESRAHPILLAPIAYQRLFHDDGERASAQAAEAMEAVMVVSTLASIPLEEIAQASRASLWFQLYIQPDRGYTRHLIERIETAGYRALVVTVDAPLSGLRNREQRAGFHLPPGVDAANLRDMPPIPNPLASLYPGQSPIFDGLLATAPTWADIAAIRAMTRLPLILKGILSPQDARQALDLGVDGLVVSNHGGRTLDTLPAAIEALPAVAQAVAGRIPLLLDGGIRRGSDIFKALALGAQAVLVGRPWVYGLAAAGPLGAAHVLKLLREELEVVMALTGCACLSGIGPAALWPRPD